MPTSVDLSDSPDIALNVRSISVFGYKKALGGVYVVAKLRSGVLVALNRAYEQVGFLIGDRKALWQESWSVTSPGFITNRTWTSAGRRASNMLRQSGSISTMCRLPRSRSRLCTLPRASDHGDRCDWWLFAVWLLSKPGLPAPPGTAGGDELPPLRSRRRRPLRLRIRVVSS
jgi:hypothetical protein